MIDYIVKVASIAAAKAALPAWVVSGNFQLPTWCDILQVDAYTALATYDGSGNQLTPPTFATGKWFLVSLDRNVTVPAGAAGAIQAQSDRLVPMQLPAGIKGLSTVWAGMLPLIPG